MDEEKKKKRKKWMTVLLGFSLASEGIVCSIKKRIIVRRSVRSMFGRTNIRQVKNGLKSACLGQCGSFSGGADDKAPVVAAD